MLKGLFLKKTGAVGLELDAGEIRAVELGGSPGAPELVAWGRIPLPRGAVEEGMVLQPNIVARTLEELWLKAGISSREVILGVANQAVLVRIAAFPNVAPAKIPQIIRYQAQEYLPVPLNTVVLDHEVIGEAQGEKNQLDVLLVAARREMLDSFLLALKEAKLEPRDIDVSSLAILRLLPAQEAEEALVLVNIANDLSNILVVARDVPRLARLMPIRMQEAEEQAASTLEDDIPILLKKEKIMTGNLNAWGRRLGGEIAASISYYETLPGAYPVKGVILSGAGARTEGLAAMLKDGLGLPVSMLEPLKGITVTQKGIAIAGDSPDFAVSISLARRGLEG